MALADPSIMVRASAVGLFVFFAAACGTGDATDDGDNEQDALGSGGTPSAGGAALTSTQTIYVAFDGVHVDNCSGECSDARVNQSWAIGAHFGQQAIDFLPYGNDEERNIVLEGLRAAYAPYDVAFTTTRPESGDYTMVIVSATGGPHHGVAPLDCGNANKNDIAFVYRTTLSSPQLVAREAAHELGHSFGLAHVASNADFMQWASSGSSFTVALYDSAHPSGTCFEGTTQDAPSLLAAALGTK
jgi:hypothetical protein